jgi:predicted CoA-binding protein
VSELPDSVTKAIILTKPEHTDAILNKLHQKGIKDVWVQQMSETKESKNISEKLQLNVVFNRCVYMFAEPVAGMHSFHRTILKFFGRLK